jgi:hypothetical protein
MMSELQSNLISILVTIDDKAEFTLSFSLTEIDCELDADYGCFYCTISGEDGFLPIDVVRIELPLASLD